MSDLKIIAALREENAMLRELVRQLREEVAPRPVFPAEWRLSPHQTKILSCVIKASPGLAPYSRILAAVYDGHREAPEWAEQQIHVQVTKMRQRLRAAGIELTLRVVWGLGYVLSDAERERLLACRSDEAERRAA